jgi:hypothetical protein
MARLATSRRPQRGLTSTDRRRSGAPRSGSQHLDGKSAAALADAAAFKRLVVSHVDGVLAGLPIACPHLAKLFDDYQKKAMDKAVKELHDPTPVKSTKPAASSDDDDIDSLRAQLKKTNVTIQSSLHWVTGPWCHCPPGIKEFSPEINSVLLFLSCFACRSTTHRRARGLFWFRFRTGGSKVSAVEHRLADSEL